MVGKEETKDGSHRDMDHEDEYYHIKGQKEKQAIELFKQMGYYMREFSPFYELTSMTKSSLPDDIKKKEDDIIMTIEMSLKSIRSAQNKNTKLKKNKVTYQKFIDFLGILEDEVAGRYSHHDLVEKKKESLKALRKLMPPEYMLELRPSHFTYLDSERIKTIIQERYEDFMTQTPNKVMFVVCCKIYHYHCEVYSVRILLAKFFKYAVALK